MNRTYLQRLICRKLFSGQLPASGVTIYGGTAAGGESCDACTEAISAGQVILHGVARSNLRDQAIRFHPVCFDIWDLERRALSIVRPSARRQPSAIA